MQKARRLHLYLGLFFGPSLLFFALTGVMQTLDLHRRSEGYQPPTWLLELAQVHKNQTAELPSQNGERRRRDNAPSAAEGGDEDRPARRHRRHRRHREEEESTATPAPDDETAPAAAEEDRPASGERRHRRRRDDEESTATPAASATPAAEAQDGQANPEAGERPRPRRPRSHGALKAYFVLTGLGLILSILGGFYMAFRYNRDRRLIAALLISGTLLPLLFVWL